MIDWINDPRLHNMDPLKIELMKTAASQTAGKSGNALVPILMALITNANKKGIQFSQDEVSLVLELMKEGKSKQEQAQIDKMIQMVTTMMKNYRKV